MMNHLVSLPSGMTSRVQTFIFSRYLVYTFIVFFAYVVCLSESKHVKIVKNILALVTKWVPWKLETSKALPYWEFD